VTRGRERYPEDMENSARSGLGTRLIAWAVLALVALVVIKFAFGIVFGLIQAVFTLALLAVIGLGVIWALRHL
jgi:ABC-type iron transport system FetAB permease component